MKNKIYENNFIGMAVLSQDKHKVDGILKRLKNITLDINDKENIFKEVKLLYKKLDLSEKEQLFRSIIEQIEVQKQELVPMINKANVESMDNIQWSLFLSELRQKLSSPRLNMLLNISRIPGGLRFLLNLRSDILTIKRELGVSDLKALDRDIVLLFEMWFCEGFLYLEEITLDSTYRQIEIIKNSDLVHPMISVEEMIRRLGKDKRCFALYHKLIPHEPIVFIEVALTKGIPKRIDEIIGKDVIKEERIDTATFYSINNTQNGLAGLGLGKVLIARVMEYLRKEDSRIKNFVTLSPMPGFWERYLKAILQRKDKSFSLKADTIENFFSKKQKLIILKKAGINIEDSDLEWQSFNKRLLHILSKNDWPKDKEIVKALRMPLTKIAAHYLLKEKTPNGKPLNPVANFHIRNGATVSDNNINFLANTSTRGLMESCGIMVNYIYSLNFMLNISRHFRWLGSIVKR